MTLKSRILGAALLLAAPAAVLGATTHDCDTAAEITTALTSAVDGDTVLIRASGSPYTMTQGFTLTKDLTITTDGTVEIDMDAHGFILNGESGGTTMSFSGDSASGLLIIHGAPAASQLFLTGNSSNAGNLTVTFRYCQLYSGQLDSQTIYQDHAKGYNATIYVYDSMFYGPSHPSSQDGHSVHSTTPGWGNNVAEWHNVTAKFTNGQCLTGHEGARISAYGSTFTQTDADSDADGTISACVESASSTAPVDEVQTLTFSGTASGGSMTLTVPKLDGTTVTTAAIAWNTTDATWLSNINNAIDTALGINTADSSIVASGASPDAALTFTFSGCGWSGMRAPVGQTNWTAISADTSSLTGATGAATLARTTIGGGKVNHVYLEDCSLTNASITADANHCGLLQVGSGNHAHAVRCTFATSVAKPSVTVAALGWAQFENCTFTTSGGDDSINGNGMSLVNDCTFNLSASSDGLQLGSGTSTLDGCTFNCTGPSHPVYATSSGRAALRNSSVVLTGTHNGASGYVYTILVDSTASLLLDNVTVDATAATISTTNGALVANNAAGARLDVWRCRILGPATIANANYGVYYVNASGTGSVLQTIFASYQTAGASVWRGLYLTGTTVPVSCCIFDGFTYNSAAGHMMLRLAGATGYTTPAQTGNNYFGDEPAVQTNGALDYRIFDASSDLAVGSLRAGDQYGSDAAIGYRDRANKDFRVEPSSPVYRLLNQELPDRIWWH